VNHRLAVHVLRDLAVELAELWLDAFFLSLALECEASVLRRSVASDERVVVPCILFFFRASQNAPRTSVTHTGFLYFPIILLWEVM
jgi:hypothetical protein